MANESLPQDPSTYPEEIAFREGRRSGWARLRALIGRATYGPWWVERPAKRDAYVAYGTKGDLSDTYDLYEAYNVDTDYEYIAEADPVQIAGLLMDRDRYKAEAAAYREALSQISEQACHVADARRVAKAALASPPADAKGGQDER